MGERLKKEKSFSSITLSELEISNRAFLNTCNSKRGTEHDIPFHVSENVAKEINKLRDLSQMTLNDTYMAICYNLVHFGL